MLEGDTLRSKKLVSGLNRPMDVMVEDGKLYVLDMGNNNGSGRTIYEITLSAPNPTNLFPEIDTQLAIYPNPARDRLHIDIEGGQSIKKVCLYDPAGNQIRHYANEPNVLFISDLQPKLYIIEILLQNGQKIRKKMLKL